MEHFVFLFILLWLLFLTLKYIKMATKEELNAAIDGLQADVDAKQAAIAAEVQALKDQIANGSPVTPEDLDALVAKVNATRADIVNTNADGTVNTSTEPEA